MGVVREFAPGFFQVRGGLPVGRLARAAPALRHQRVRRAPLPQRQAPPRGKLHEGGGRGAEDRPGEVARRPERGQRQQVGRPSQDVLAQGRKMFETEWEVSQSMCLILILILILILYRIAILNSLVETDRESARHVQVGCGARPELRQEEEKEVSRLSHH